MNLEKLTINKLIVFNTVLRYGSAATAARVLKVPVIKIHNDIKSMEKSVGTPLLMRNQRKIELTEAGRKVANFARYVIDALYNEDQELEFSLPEDLVIAAPSGFCEKFLPDILVEFHSLHPSVHLKILSGSEYLDFTNNDVDVVIGDHLSNRSDLTQNYLYTNNYRLFGSRNFLEEHGEPKNREDLKNFPIIHYHGFPFSLEKIVPDISITFTTNNFNLITELIAKGAGLGLLREDNLFRVPEVEKTMVALFNGYTFYVQKFMFITRKFTHKSQLTNSLHKIISEHVASYQNK